MHVFDTKVAEFVPVLTQVTWGLHAAYLSIH